MSLDQQSNDRSGQSRLGPELTASDISQRDVLLKLYRIMAALWCLQTPLGTALAVFTLVVILRPGVKAHLAL